MVKWYQKKPTGKSFGISLVYVFVFAIGGRWLLDAPREVGWAQISQCIMIFVLSAGAACCAFFVRNYIIEYNKNNQRLPKYSNLRAKISIMGAVSVVLVVIIIGVDFYLIPLRDFIPFWILFFSFSFLLACVVECVKALKIYP